MLSSEALIEGLLRVGGLPRAAAEQGLVLLIERTGMEPVVRVVGGLADGMRLGGDGAPIGLLDEIVHDRFAPDSEGRLIIVADLDMEENEPLPGMTWTNEDRRKGASMGVMPVLVMLLRRQRAREILFERPMVGVSFFLEGDVLEPTKGSSALPNQIRFLRRTMIDESRS